MSSRATEIKWAFIFAGALLLWMIMEKLLGFHDDKIAQHPTISMLFIIVALALYYFALKEKREKDLGGKMTWKQGFISGVIIGLIMMVLSPILQYIIHGLVSPDYFTNAINHSVELGKVSQEDAEAYFNLKNYMIEGAISSPLMGAVTAAIMALFLKKE